MTESQCVSVTLATNSELQCNVTGCSTCYIQTSPTSCSVGSPTNHLTTPVPDLVCCDSLQLFLYSVPLRHLKQVVAPDTSPTVKRKEYSGISIKGHYRKYLSTKDTFGCTMPSFLIGATYRSNTIFISEEWTTSLQWTN